MLNQATKKIQRNRSQREVNNINKSSFEEIVLKGNRTKIKKNIYTNEDLPEDNYKHIGSDDNNGCLEDKRFNENPYDCISDY